MGLSTIPPPLKIIFMGTPTFAATILHKLVGWEKTVITAVYCQPDRPAGRGHKIQLSPVKEIALKHSIPVHQPISFKDENELQSLRNYAPDFLVVAAYGMILPQQVLNIPKGAPVNVHASLLPFYRGAAPIQRAIMAGEVMTGITIMHMEKGLDTGPMYAQKAMAISITDTAETISDQLAKLGATLLIDVLTQVIQGQLPEAIPQDNARASYAEKLVKTDGDIPWGKSAQQVHNHIRGVTPWPGARTTICFNSREPISVTIAPGDIGKRGDVIPLEDTNKNIWAVGKILGLVGDALAIACDDQPYLVRQLQPAGSKTMTAQAFWNGYMQGNNSGFCCPLNR